MAYNIPERYSDLTPAPQLDKKTLNKMVWMSCFLQASFNYERMQACGWLWGFLPGLKKIHTNKEDLKAYMAHHLDFLHSARFLHSLHTASSPGLSMIIVFSFSITSLKTLGLAAGFPT